MIGEKMAIEIIKYKGHKICIEYDDSPMNPREEETMTEIHCYSGRYYLGEYQHKRVEDIQEVVKQAKRQGDMVLDLFAYIHGGVALSLQSFEGRIPSSHYVFDSGKCGVVIVRRKVMLDNYGRGKKVFTHKLKKRAYEIAKTDVEEFGHYLSGEVYGYVIDDYYNSCWGFYEIEEALEAGREAVDDIVYENKKNHFRKLKEWIKNGVPLQYRTPLSC